MKNIDRRKAFRDIYGSKEPERLSEYFDFARWPEKAARPVTRHELSIFLDSLGRGLEAQRWTRRAAKRVRALWTWLRRPFGSGPATIVAVEHPTQDPTPTEPTP